MSSLEYRTIYGSNEIMQVGFAPPNGRIKKQVNNGYATIRETLNSIDGIYSKTETRDRLLYKDLYKSLFGRAKNRTLIKSDPKLYKSLMYYTNQLSFLKRTGMNSFTGRIKFIIQFNCNLELLKCNCGKSYTFENRCRYCPLPRLDFRAHSNETRKKIRLSTIKYLSSLKGQLAPRYNKNSISIIEQYGNENGYNFQHAENGGEFHIPELGYWVDAYDKINNIVLEIDEDHHFTKNGEYNNQDLLRQTEIENYLGCKFIRIRYVDK